MERSSILIEIRILKDLHCILLKIIMHGKIFKGVFIFFTILL